MTDYQTRRGRRHAGTSEGEVHDWRLFVERKFEVEVRDSWVGYSDSNFLKCRSRRFRVILLIC